ncbi:hypothetical protein NNJEOMEG_01329 [Fundidesulfovibrio magnetotacticus]|uniref:Acyl-coenzyme A:6-aminopenicillanic acid acyl-transferase n=1 Tax=Fundidesulfovibrio magnetotacticus TaxID=2730080 RepID=A0A6V8LUK7_9BACT|nr:C45 family peptidase [Fundidesulfovibrio magnetotacticus]GFK93496.1 hypothetical protein NNJEOMEG_01329 [Fundidesulfovibrio magnetotacticus]
MSPKRNTFARLAAALCALLLLVGCSGSLQGIGAPPLPASENDAAARLPGSYTTGLIANLADLDPTDTFFLQQSFEQGRLYSNHKIRIVSLKGSWQDMGRQYGALLGRHIKEMRAAVSKQLLQAGIARSEADLTAFAAKLAPLYPPRFQAMLQGVRQTSGLPASDMAVLNGFFDFILSTQNAQATCAAIAAWEPVSGDGRLVLGRNFDFAPFFKNFAPQLVITVLNPDDGSTPTASIGYAGQLGSISTFNAAGLTLENNNGALNGDTTRHFLQRTPFLARDVELLLDNRTLDALGEQTAKLQMAFPLLYMVTDARRAVVYEAGTERVARRDPAEPGLLVASNTPLDPGWPAPPAAYKDIAQDSRVRYDNLVRLARAYKAALDDRVMMAILDTPTEEGGATPKGNGHDTWQYVAVPADLRLWFKAPGYLDWTPVDLKKYFR